MPDPPEPSDQQPRARDRYRTDPADIASAVPSAARMYNYVLGGKNHFAADRIAAEQALALVPQARRIALANKYFLGRSVLLMAEQGVSQYLDLGTGIPTSPTVHEIARAANPTARVVYVDSDPVVTVHNRALLAASEGIRAIDGDIRRPEGILNHPSVADLIDFSQPVGVLMVAVLHFITDDEGPGRVVQAFADRMSQGSFLALSHATSEGTDSDAMAAIRDAYAHATAQAVFRPAAQIRGFFTGFEIQPPGLIDVVDWFPYARIFAASSTVRVLGGLGQKQLWRLPCPVPTAQTEQVPVGAKSMTRPAGR